MLGRFYTASSTSGTRWVSGVVLDSYLPLYFCLLCVLVSTCPCLSQFLSLILDLAYRIRSGFVSRSLLLFFLGCSRVSVTLSFQLSLRLTLFLFLFFPSRCLSSLISPAWSPRTPPAPIFRDSLSRGEHPSPPGHLQVQRPPFSEPEETWGWKQSALVWAVVRGLNESRKGRLPAPGPRALHCCEPGLTKAAVWTALAARAPPFTPFFA